jgi:hypothetical protein
VPASHDFDLLTLGKIDRVAAFHCTSTRLSDDELASMRTSTPPQAQEREQRAILDHRFLERFCFSCSFSTMSFLRAARPLARLSTRSISPLLSRTLATEASPRPPASREYQTVEDLHSKTAAEILNERDAGKAGGKAVLLQPQASGAVLAMIGSRGDEEGVISTFSSGALFLERLSRCSLYKRARERESRKVSMARQREEETSTTESSLRTQLSFSSFHCCTICS